MEEEIKQNFYTVTDVMDKMNVSRTTLWRWVKDGQFPKPFKWKNETFFSKDAVEEFHESVLAGDPLRYPIEKQPDA